MVHAYASRPSASRTRDAAAFAAALRRLPSSDDARAQSTALAAAAAAAGTSAARLIARAASAASSSSAATDVRAAAEHTHTAAALLAERRFQKAAEDIGRFVARQYTTWHKVLVAGPSAVVEEAVISMASARTGAFAADAKDFIVVVLGDADVALRLAAEPGVRVEFAPLAAAANALAACDAVLLGAESIHVDGRLVVAQGVAAVAVLAADVPIPVYALVQTIKFERDVLLAETDRPTLEMLDGRFVASIFTEVGEYSPRDAPKVSDAYGIA